MRKIALLTAAAGFALTAPFAFAQAPAPDATQRSDSSDQSSKTALEQNLGIGSPAGAADVDAAVSAMSAAPDFSGLSGEFQVEAVAITPTAKCDAALAQQGSESSSSGTPVEMRAGILCTDDAKLAEAMSAVDRTQVQAAIESNAELRARLEAQQLDTSTVVGASTSDGMVRIYTAPN